MSFGVMGADMQPQGHVQMVVRLADYGQNPQASLDAPRWKVYPGKQIVLEHAVPRRSPQNWHGAGMKCGTRSGSTWSTAQAS